MERKLSQPHAVPDGAPSLLSGRPRARGAVSNRASRHELARVAEDDGWGGDGPAQGEDDGPPPLDTEITVERPRRIISYNRSPDLPFDRSINPYRGCEHGCIYCFARPTHAWLGLSPGLDFETRLVARPDAPKVLEAELRRPGYRVAPLALGTNTDPYQPAERERRITRACLKVLAAFGHPVAIVTKGAMIERDIDILAPMAERGLVRVGVSVTTLDEELARRMEPRCPAPRRRLRVIARLAAAGIPVRVMLAPVVPGLTDHECEAILAAARASGAEAASWIMLRLPQEVATLFREWLETHFPERAERVMGLVRAMHGGRDYDPAWGRRMRGAGPHAELVAQRMRKAMRRLGLRDRLPPLSCDLFAPPPRPGDQLTLL